MVRLIVGLGNPGAQYEKTRHNVGFLFLDYLLLRVGGEWQVESRFDAIMAACGFGGHKVLLLKPQTYMNRSGLSVGKVARYYKIAPEEILIVHDELDFEVGVARLKIDGGHAGHNGLRDIIGHLNSKEFFRLRIGIGRPVSGRVIADYVLSQFSKGEFGLIDHVFGDVGAYIDSIAAGNVDLVMNKLNTAIICNR